MTLIVNLSTAHDYSIDETIAAFVQTCNQYSKGMWKEASDSLGVGQTIFNFFQDTSNYLWVLEKFHANKELLIEPYKLGKISSPEFLDNLANIFAFLKDMDKGQRDSLFINAWNASIKLSEKRQGRLSRLLEESKNQPVYLISNTNELNANAIIDLFKANNPDLQFIANIDTSIKESKEPIEILPNIYLCLSYRFGAFKEESPSTVSLIECLSERCQKPISLVSQYPGDLKKAEQLGFDTLDAEIFYNSRMSNLSQLK